MNNVKSYTAKQLLDKVETLKNFKGIPETYWVLAVRSNEDGTDIFDDKCYLFRGSKFVLVTSCTTNKGNKGTGVVCANIWNYGAWIIGKHKGKVKAGLQRVGFPYQRDFTPDGKTNPTTEIKTDIRGFNFHPADHDINRKIIKTKIGGWSEGCIVLNDIPTYLKIINLLEPQKIWSMVIVDEF
jgi:hypothetical protein